MNLHFNLSIVPKWPLFSGLKVNSGKNDERDMITALLPKHHEQGCVNELSEQTLLLHVSCSMKWMDMSRSIILNTDTLRNFLNSDSTIFHNFF